MLQKADWPTMMRLREIDAIAGQSSTFLFCRAAAELLAVTAGRRVSANNPYTLFWLPESAVQAYRRKEPNRDEHVVARGLSREGWLRLQR